MPPFLFQWLDIRFANLWLQLAFVGVISQAFIYFVNFIINILPYFTRKYINADESKQFTYFLQLQIGLIRDNIKKLAKKET